MQFSTSFAILALAVYSQAKDVEKGFEKADIVPSIVPEFEPTLDLHVTYVVPNATAYPYKSVDLGNIFNLSGE
jgi:hypothetical protein